MKNILVSIFILILCWQVHVNTKTEVRIVHPDGNDMVLVLPRKDRERLEHFFYAMMVREDGGYTLFGAKPMHMYVFFQPLSISKWDYFLSSITPHNLRMYRDWKVWEKYQYLMEKSDFKFWIEKNPFLEKRAISDNPAVSIFFINKMRVDEIIRNYSNDFQSILKDAEFCYGQFMADAKNSSLFNGTLKGHEGLIGTLFGYGRENAWLFEERDNGKPVVLKYPWERDVEEFYMKQPYITWQYLGVHSDLISENLGYPGFVANPDSEETKQLKQKFLATRKKIIDYYAGKDFLEATLSILINGIPSELLDTDVAFAIRSQ